MNTKYPDTKHDILALEINVWDALVSGDVAADAAALSNGFLGVYEDGLANKADHVGQLADGPTVLKFALHDVQCRTLGAAHCLLSYRAEFQRVGGNPPETMYVSSIWEWDDTRWVNIFSQDTSAIS